MSDDLYDDTPDFDEYAASEALDPEGPSAADIERFSDEHITCPSCRSDVYDQTELCPHCGHVFEEGSGAAGRWMVVIAISVLLVFLIFMVL